MIAYFDTSALLAILLLEPELEIAVNLWDGTDRIVSSRVTYAEGRAGLAAAHRLGRLPSPLYRATKESFEDRFREIHQIEPTRQLCRAAGDLAERHQLKGYDAVHLASALTTEAEGIILMTGDKTLGRAAAAEGIRTALSL